MDEGGKEDMWRVSGAREDTWMGVRAVGVTARWMGKIGRHNTTNSNSRS